jgi:hypothetical protein
MTLTRPCSFPVPMSASRAVPDRSPEIIDGERLGGTIVVASWYPNAEKLYSNLVIEVPCPSAPCERADPSPLGTVRAGGCFAAPSPSFPTCGGDTGKHRGGRDGRKRGGRAARTATTRTGREEEAPTSRSHDGGHGGPDRADRGRRRGEAIGIRRDRGEPIGIRRDRGEIGAWQPVRRRHYRRSDGREQVDTFQVTTGRWPADSCGAKPQPVSRLSSR